MNLERWDTSVVAYQMAISSEGLSMALPLLGTLAFGAQRLLPVIQQAYSSWSVIKGGIKSLEELLILLDQSVANFEEIKQDSIVFNKEIIFDNISYGYGACSEYVIKDLSFKIHKGARIGIVGSTGEGKSTLLDLLTGLLKPNKGSIKVDDLYLTDQNHQLWLRHIAQVPQFIYLIDGTVEENIAYGESINEIDRQSLMLAALQAQISKDIESWPLGYNTRVGENGIQLSGGQRQRIGIARALYKKAEVIILDEATSALDSHTESEVVNAINSINKNITLIIVTHGISTLSNCSEIYKLENKKLIKQ